MPLHSVHFKCYFPVNNMIKIKPTSSRRCCCRIKMAWSKIGYGKQGVVASHFCKFATKTKCFDYKWNVCGSELCSV